MVRVEADKASGGRGFTVSVATADATVTDALRAELCTLLAQL